MGALRVNLRASSLRRALKYPLCPKTGGQPFTVGPYCLEREATGFGVSPSLWVRTSKATPSFLCVEIWNSLEGLGNPKVGALVERCPRPPPNLFWQRDFKAGALAKRRFLWPPVGMGPMQGVFNNLCILGLHVWAVQ